MSVKQYQLHPGTSGLDLVMVDVPDQEVGPHDVLIKVQAVSLNYRDLLMRDGKSASSAKAGHTVPCSDGAGEVVAVGAEVTRVKVGDRVAGCFFTEWVDGRFDMRYHQGALGGSASGMLSELVVLSEQGVVTLPDCLSYEEAACLPCAALTAWYALVERGGLAQGDSVLLLGTGGVSIFALQIAAAKGATIIITSSSDEKLERAKALGATHGINYKSTEAWEKEAWALTDKRGVDHVVEVGGPGTLGKSMGAVSAGGHIALIGVLTGFDAPDESLFPLVAKNVQLNGIYVGHRTAFERLLAFAEEVDLHPVIDRAFDFEEAGAAFDHLASGTHFGKVVIKGMRQSPS